MALCSPGRPGGIRPGESVSLSARTGIHRSDLVAVINELAARELVERTPDPEDRRRNVITVTALGRRRLRTLEQILDAAQDELLAPLSAQERQQLVRLLGRIVEHHAHGDPAMEPGDR